ncbi:MAG: hypothetical protein OXG61_13885 [Chloroflexi bacterium]|nr:hypothetical protein [Chloroflexota bacterium]
MAERDTYKYHLKKGNKVVHRGITNDLDRHQTEHQAQFPGAKIEQDRSACETRRSNGSAPAGSDLGGSPVKVYPDPDQWRPGEAVGTQQRVTNCTRVVWRLAAQKRTPISTGDRRRLRLPVPPRILPTHLNMY